MANEKEPEENIPTIGELSMEEMMEAFDEDEVEFMNELHVVIAKRDEIAKNN